MKSGSPIGLPNYNQYSTGKNNCQIKTPRIYSGSGNVRLTADFDDVHGSQNRVSIIFYILHGEAAVRRLLGRRIDDIL